MTVTASATPAVTVLGQTDSENDYSQNQVVVSNDGTALEISADVVGMSFKNLDFVNTGPLGEAVAIRGTQIGF